MAERSFPYKDQSGRWHNPASGKFMSNANAKRSIRLTERNIMISNITRGTGLTKAQVRERIKGIPTDELVGKWRYRDKVTGQQIRSGASARGRAALDDLGVSGNLLRY